MNGSPVPRYFFFLPGIGDRPGLGRANGRGWRVQWHSEQRDEHGRSIGGIDFPGCFWFFCAEGILDCALLRYRRRIVERCAHLVILNRSGDVGGGVGG